jgi:hypothetical protein
MTDILQLMLLLFSSLPAKPCTPCIISCQLHGQSLPARTRRHLRQRWDPPHRCLPSVLTPCTGPEVFLPREDALALAVEKKGICAEHGLEGVFPFDLEAVKPPPLIVNGVATPELGTVLVFRQDFALAAAFGSHACPLEASRRVIKPCTSRVSHLLPSSR